MKKLLKLLRSAFDPTITERYDYKLMAGVLLAMAAFVPAVGIAAISLSAIGNEQNELARFNHREVLLSQDLKEPMQDEDRLRPLFILTGDPRFLEHLQQAQHEFDSVLSRLKALEAPDTQVSRMLDTIALFAQRHRALTGHAISMRIQGESLQDIDRFYQQNKGHAFQDLHDSVEALQKLMRARFEHFIIRQHRTLHDVGLMLLAANGFAVLLCAGIGLMTYRLLRTKKAHDAALVREADWQSTLATARKEAVETVAHDLRQPLQVMMFAADKLQRAAATSRQSEQAALDAFTRSASAMRRLIDTVLHPEVIDTGTMPVIRNPLDLHEMLRDVVSRFRLTAAAAQVNLIHVPDRHRPQILADSARLDQVFSNLLGNAVKFTPAGGSVILSTASTGSWVRVTVTDTGCGMTREQLQQVFSRYWRGGTAAQHGSGLGLAISKAIIDAHGGRIEADSMPDHGSSFTVHLPLTPTTLADDAARSGTIAVAEAG